MGTILLLLSIAAHTERAIGERALCVCGTHGPGPKPAVVGFIYVLPEPGNRTLEPIVRLFSSALHVITSDLFGLGHGRMRDARPTISQGLPADQRYGQPKSWTAGSRAMPRIGQPFALMA